MIKLTSSIVAVLTLMGSCAVSSAQTNTNRLPRYIENGPFKPTWESLAAGYQCPDWFRDAKFGIWAHWSAQCVPEQGDWYARNMYIQGTSQYNFHVAHYGPPSKFGFMEIDNLWHAENWDPEKLMDLYVRAGAKYFVALANHHDNFDNYDSMYHPWNSVNVGPHKDIVGTWAAIARKRGLRFGVSNHSAHSWHWFQVAYGYDGEGPLAGVRYDAATLTAADGKGKWWDGLDPQLLYTGPTMVMPDGLTSAREVRAWHERNDRIWNENPPTNNPSFTENWYLRCQDLIDKYRPDLVYFDNDELPLGDAGLDIVAHYYNSSLEWQGERKAGPVNAHAVSTYYAAISNAIVKPSVVVNGKQLKPAHRPALVEDYERGSSDVIQPLPWQTDTCIGEWHYNRRLFEQHRYKTVGQVVRMLVNVVSKNGNLLLSVPVRGDGTIDSDETAFLDGMAKWMAVNSEGIFGSRPWKVYGEGPARGAAGMFNENNVTFGAKDIRYTTKDGNLYAYFLGWPDDGKLDIKTLAKGSPEKRPLLEKTISSLTLLGSKEKIAWTQDTDGLHVTLPAKKPCDDVFALKVVLK